MCHQSVGYNLFQTKKISKSAFSEKCYEFACCVVFVNRTTFIESSFSTFFTFHTSANLDPEMSPLKWVTLYLEIKYHDNA